MSRRIALAACCLATISLYGEEATRSISSPVAVEVPESQVAAWTECSQAGLALHSTRRFSVADRLVRPWRLDVLLRRSGRWTLSSSATLDKGDVLPQLPREARVGLLLRSCSGEAPYGWAEVDGESPAEVSFRLYKTIPIGADEAATLFVASETSPRELSRANARQFERVPLTDAFLCTTREQDICRFVPAGDVVPSGAIGREPRVFFIERQNVDVEALVAGNSVLRPHPQETIVNRAGSWTVIALPRDVSWDSTLLRIHSTASETADAVFAGAGLLRPPGVNQLPAARDCGLRIRALVGSHKSALVDPQAHLLIFSTMGPLIPMADLRQDGESIFVAPGLPAGDYRLKLLSVLAGSAIVPAEIGTGSVMDAYFPSARTVRGRIVSPVGGSTRATILVVKRASDGSSASGPPDPADGTREVQTDEDGRFFLGLTAPGEYLLNVVSDSKRAERRFAIKKGDEETDLGDIALGDGVTLRGQVTPCLGGGQVVLVPLPDPTGTLASIASAVRKVPIDADGRFVADNLPAGSWLAQAACAGTEPAMLDPEPFVLPAQGTVVLAFHRAK